MTKEQATKDSEKKRSITHSNDETEDKKKSDKEHTKKR